MVDFSDPQLISGTVESGEQIRVQVDITEGAFSNDSIVLMVGSADHSRCFGGSKSDAVQPGDTMTADVEIPLNFAGTVNAGLEAAAPGVPCDNWLEDIGVFNEVTLGETSGLQFRPDRELEIEGTGSGADYGVTFTEGITDWSGLSSGEEEAIEEGQLTFSDGRVSTGTDVIIGRGDITVFHRPQENPSPFLARVGGEEVEIGDGESHTFLAPEFDLSKVGVVECTAGSNQIGLGGGSISVDVTLSNGNSREASVSLRFDVGPLTKGTPTIDVPPGPGTTRTVTLTITAAEAEQLSGDTWDIGDARIAGGSEADLQPLSRA